MNLINNPCKTCTERYHKCHSECEKYIKAKAEHKELMAQIRKDNPINEYIADARFKRNKRYMK